MGGFPSVEFESREGQEPHQGRTWEKWQALGFDHYPVLADPLFVDPYKGDFRVKPESPALKLGFYNFDMDHFGLLPGFTEIWRE